MGEQTLLVPTTGLSPTGVTGGPIEKEEQGRSALPLRHEHSLLLILQEQARTAEVTGNLSLLYTTCTSIVSQVIVCSAVRKYFQLSILQDQIGLKDLSAPPG